MQAPEPDWRDDHEHMLMCALRWAPFGGGDPADIYIHFGIDEATYFARLTELLTTTTPPGGIDDLTWSWLLHVARQRVTTATGGADPLRTTTRVTHQPA